MSAGLRYQAKHSWNELLFFESPQYTAARYQEFHGGEASAAKLAEIGSSFRQARFFNESLESADFVVKPIILYYSVLALSRGLILFLEAKKREATLAQRHGLTTVGWSDFLNQGVSNFAALKVKIEYGTFTELLSATKNTNLVRANSSAVNFHLSSPLPPSGMEVTVDELCQRLPDLSDEYEKWTGQRLLAANLRSLIVREGKAQIKIENQKRLSGLESFDERFVRLICPKLVTFDQSEGVIVVGPEAIPMVSDIVKTAPFGVGDAVVLPRINDEFISNLGMLFMLAYILSMLARYHPSHWISMQSIGPKGRFFPYCIRLVEYIEYSYPRTVVDVLSNLDRVR